MLYSIISIAAIIFEYIVTIMFIKNFIHEKDLKIFVKIMRPAVFCAMVYFFNQIVKIPAAMALISLAIYYGISLFFSGSTKKRFFVIIGYMGLILISELITVVVLMFGGASVQNMLEDYNMYRMLGTVVSKIVLLCIIRIVFMFSNKNQKIYLSYWFGLLTIPAINLVLLLIITAFLYNINNSISIPILVSVISILYTTILVFWLFEKLTSLLGENSLLGNQIVSQASWTKRTQADTEHIKSIQHDLKNHINVLYKILKCNGLKEAELYIESLNIINDKKENEISTGNISIDSVLSAKKNEAKSNGITVNYNIIIPENLKMDNVDECVLFGNLLDNAIEACVRSRIPNKTIDFTLKYSGEYLTCTIKNPSPSDVKFRNGVPLSTKKDSDNHGIGIKNINKIVSKYNGTIQMNMENGYFITQLMLFM